MAVKQILSWCPKGRRPMLQVIIDLTTLEKRGKFKAFEKLVRVYHGKRGLHLVVLYLVVGHWRLPWSFRIYRGKDTASPAQRRIKTGTRLTQSTRQAFSGDDSGRYSPQHSAGFQKAADNVRRLWQC